MPLKQSSLQHLDNMLARYPDLCENRHQVIWAVEIICECYHSHGKLLVCGNGGSAADSEHIVGELMKGFRIPRAIPAQDAAQLKAGGFADWEKLSECLQQGIPSIALTSHVSLSTAVLNDTDPYMIFAQQVYVYGQEGDVLVALSTSGEARNVLNALKVARAFGLKTIGMTGQKQNSMELFCDVIIKAPASDTSFRVQEYHLPLYHAMCLMVEEEVFG